MTTMSTKSFCSDTKKFIKNIKILYLKYLLCPRLIITFCGKDKRERKNNKFKKPYEKQKHRTFGFSSRVVVMSLPCQ